MDSEAQALFPDSHNKSTRRQVVILSCICVILGIVCIGLVVKRSNSESESVVAAPTREFASSIAIASLPTCTVARLQCVSPDYASLEIELPYCYDAANHSVYTQGDKPTNHVTMIDQEDSAYFNFAEIGQNDIQYGAGGIYLSYSVTADFRIKESFHFTLSKATISATLKITAGTANTPVISQSCGVDFP